MKAILEKSKGTKISTDIPEKFLEYNKDWRVWLPPPEYQFEGEKFEMTKWVGETVYYKVYKGTLK